MQVFPSSLLAMIGFGVYQQSHAPVLIFKNLSVFKNLFAAISSATSTVFAFAASLFSSDPLLVFESVALVSTLLYITSVLLRREFEGEQDHPHYNDNVLGVGAVAVGAVIDSHEIRLKDFSTMKARDVAKRNFLAPISINEAGSAIVGNSISFPKKAVRRQNRIFSLASGLLLRGLLFRRRRGC
jgi:hypothetical protein